MTVTRYANNFYQGLAADTKPTNVPAGAIYRATDTGDIYHYNGSSWDLIVGASKTETLTNKTLDGSSNTFTNLPDSALSSNIPLKNAANVFSVAQIIRHNVNSQFLHLDREANTVGHTIDILFRHNDSGGNDTIYAQISDRIVDNTDTSEDGALDFQVITGGTLGRYMELQGNQLKLGLSSAARLIQDVSNIATSDKTISWGNFTGTPLIHDAAQTVTNKTVVESSNTITMRQDYTYLVYPHGATDFRVKRGSDNVIVYTSANGGTADALGALQFCRDAIGNTSPGGVVQLSEGYFPVSATFSLTGSTHRYQKYKGIGSGNVFGALTEIRALGDFPAVTIDGSSTSALGHSIEGIHFTHDQATYTNGLIRVLDHAVEMTFKDLSFADNDRFDGDCFKFEILNTTSMKTQYQNKILNCNSRGFDNFISVNMQANTANHVSVISTMDIHNCNVWNAKRVLFVDGVSGGQILDWNFDRVNFQYLAGNAVAANEAVFDYDSPASCWNHRHTNCMIWDITTPGINYANVGTSVELSLNECNPSFRIGGSGAYLNKVKVWEYYGPFMMTPANSGWITPPETAVLGRGLLTVSSVLQAPTVGTDSRGPYLNFASGTTQGTNTGTRRGGALFRMDQSIYFEFMGTITNSSQSRVYIGLGTNISLTDTDTIIGTTDSGIFAGWRSSDTNIMIFHHDGDGSAMTVIDTGIAKNTNEWKFGLLTTSTSFTWFIHANGASKVGAPVTTQIPAASTGLNVAVEAQNTTTTSINVHIREVKIMLRGM